MLRTNASTHARGAFATTLFCSLSDNRLAIQRRRSGGILPRASTGTTLVYCGTMTRRASASDVNHIRPPLLYSTLQMELPGTVVSDARTSSYEINSSFVLPQFNSCHFVFLKWIVLALNIYLGHLRLRKSLFQFNVTVWHLPLPICFV